MTNNTDTAATSAERAALLPCPWCAAGTTKIVHNGRVWTGMQWSEPLSVSVRHWCKPVAGQPSRMIERVGRDEASAVDAWNRRASLAAAPAESKRFQAARDFWAQHGSQSVLDMTTTAELHNDAEMVIRGHRTPAPPVGAAPAAESVASSFDTAMAVLRQIADMPRRSREQRLASSCVQFLDALNAEPTTAPPVGAGVPAGWALVQTPSA
jgi:hypothetical protein